MSYSLSTSNEIKESNPLTITSGTYRHPGSGNVLRSRLGIRRVLRRKLFQTQLPYQRKRKLKIKTEPSLRNSSLQHKTHNLPMQHRNRHPNKPSHLRPPNIPRLLAIKQSRPSLPRNIEPSRTPITRCTIRRCNTNNTQPHGRKLPREFHREWTLFPAGNSLYASTA